jgi:hypothetical protein
MRKLLKTLPLLIIFVGATMLSQRAAYAYADPGTGLLAIQAAGSAIIATGWYLRRKIYGLLHRDTATKHQSEEYSAAKEDEGTSVS